MPATPAQIAANRLNALLSTGPKTPDGKIASSRNSLSHGLLSRDALHPNEDPAAFDDFSASLWAELDPSGPMETLLAGRIIGSAWRLRRVTRIETEIFLRLSLRPGPDSQPQFLGPAFAMTADKSPRGGAIEKLTRYETHLQRMLRINLQEFLNLQKSRQATLRVKLTFESPDPSQTLPSSQPQPLQPPNPEIGFVSQIDPTPPALP